MDPEKDIHRSDVNSNILDIGRFATGSCIPPTDQQTLPENPNLGSEMLLKFQNPVFLGCRLVILLVREKNDDSLPAPSGGRVG